MNFKDKVQSMTGKEIVMAMVNGLRKRWVKLDMISYGHTKNGVCYGCAATNAICEIMNKVISLGDEDNLDKHLIRYLGVDSFNTNFVDEFEDAINLLRTGDIGRYNSYTKSLGLSLLPIPEKALPELENDYIESDLQAYEDYANTL